MFNIVLVEPEIPQNTGNIVRSCAATGAVLHLIRPLGFSVEDKYLKRAGLDYWKNCEIHYYDSIKELMDKYYNGKNFWFFSTKAALVHSDAKYSEGDFLVFGKETKGLPEPLLKENYSQTVRIPMINDTRSLNLSNSVNIGLYEALRQNEYKFLNLKGKLTK